MTELVLATQNPGKVAELRALLAPTGLEVLGLSDLGAVPPEPEETGGTFEANATIKAMAYAAATGRVCLADDSGLEVDALGGRPGVISSHFAFDGRTDGEAASLTREQRDAANNERLLRELDAVPDPARTARFVCVMVLAGVGPTFSRPSPMYPSRDGRIEDVGPTGEGRREVGPGVWAVTRGTFEGRIGPRGVVPRGAGGFGYDPLFLVGPDFARTSAELAKEEKNHLSHRGAAVRAMVERIRELAGSTFNNS